jgi:hypothetical protein
MRAQPSTPSPKAANTLSSRTRPTAVEAASGRGDCPRAGRGGEGRTTNRAARPATPCNRMRPRATTPKNRKTNPLAKTAVPLLPLLRDLRAFATFALIPPRHPVQRLSPAGAKRTHRRATPCNRMQPHATPRNPAKQTHSSPLRSPSASLRLWVHPPTPRTKPLQAAPTRSPAQNEPTPPQPRATGCNRSEKVQNEPNSPPSSSRPPSRHRAFAVPLLPPRAPVARARRKLMAARPGER